LTDNEEGEISASGMMQQVMNNILTVAAGKQQQSTLTAAD
jgi:hypothetical protein